MTKRKQRSRRSNRDGTLYQAKNGSWVAQLILGTDAKGRMIRKTFSAKTQQDAVDKMNSARVRLAQGKWVNEQKMRVQEWSEMYFRDFKDAKLSPTTLRSYQQIMKKYILPVIGMLLIDEVRALDIQRIISSVTRDGRSSGTAIKVHAVMSSLFATAQKARLIQDNPASTLWCEKPKYRASYEESVPSEEEIGKLINAAEDEPLGAAIILGIGTGMRLAEVIGLKWRYVDLPNKGLSVVRTVVDLNGKSFEKDPKSDSSKRDVELPQIVVEAMERHKERQDIEKKKNTKYKDQGWVFATKNGDVINPRNFRRSFYSLLAKVGIDKLRFKAFRHGQATFLGEQNVPLKTTQARLGHSDSKVTLKYYTHVNKALQQPAAKKVDDYMSRVSATEKQKRDNGGDNPQN